MSRNPMDVMTAARSMAVYINDVAVSTSHVSAGSIFPMVPIFGTVLISVCMSFSISIMGFIPSGMANFSSSSFPVPTTSSAIMEEANDEDVRAGCVRGGANAWHGVAANDSSVRDVAMENFIWSNVGRCRVDVKIKENYVVRNLC
mmetsp:Transcript_29217/g.61655  ORF Transcript_29217/g.61655 Transcript_29217/m.61655 type:complete len:145 (+) Transcript_29217:363-797(+)